MRAGSREHGLHVAMLTHRTPLHLGRPSRVQLYSSSMHIAMEEDSLMTRYDDDVDFNTSIFKSILNNQRPSISSNDIIHINNHEFIISFE